MSLHSDIKEMVSEVGDDGEHGRAHKEEVEENGRDGKEQAVGERVSVMVLLFCPKISV